MYLPLLCAILAVSPLSVLSASVIFLHEAPNPANDPDFKRSSSLPDVEETHTVSNSDRTVVSSGRNSVLSQIDQTATSKTSPSANEAISEVDQTYLAQQDDERALTKVNRIQGYTQDQDPNGVNDVVLKDEINTVYAMDAAGAKEMFGTSQSKILQQVSDPNGLNETYSTVEGHDIHQVQRQDSFESTGNSDTEVTYLAGAPDDVKSFYTLNTVDKHNLKHNGEGTEQDNKQSSVTGFKYSDDITETVALDDLHSTIKVNNDGVQASIDVAKTHGAHNSLDFDGNEDISITDGTFHNITVKDGDIGVSLSTNSMNNLSEFKDQDGVVGAYEGNGTDHSVTVTDGEITTNFNAANIDEMFGTSSADGVDDVAKIQQTGKSVMIDNGQRGIAVGANEVSELHGVFDNGELQQSYRGNQVDKLVAVAEGSSGGSLQASEVSGIYQTKDANGNLQTVGTEGHMVQQTVVSVDDQFGGADEVDDVLMLSTETPLNVEEYQTSESPLMVKMDGLSTPKAETNEEHHMSENLILKFFGLGSKPEYQTSEADVVIIKDGAITVTEGGNSYEVSEDRKEAGTSGLSYLADLVNKFDYLYQIGDFGRIGSVFGGKKSKIDVQITINMDI